MKKTVKTLKARAQRQEFIALFVLMFSALSIAAAILPQPVQAAQVTSRSITMSDSSPSNGVSSNGNIAGGVNSVGTGTNVTYKVKFTASTTATIKGVVVSFCDNSPFAGDPAHCTAIPGFTLKPTVNPTVTNTSGLSTGTWNVATTNGGTGGTAADHTLIYTNASAATSTASGATVEFTIAGINNPSTTNHSYYARIFTYASDTAATAYTDDVPGTHIDDGGIALSTANNIQITAKVQETLVFCVSATDITAATCGGTLTAPDLLLGHGSNNTLDSSQVDTMSAYSQVSSNALTGVTVRIRNSNKCGGLSRIDVSLQTPSPGAAGGCDIPAVNNVTSGGTVAPAPAAAIAANTAGFGVNVKAGTTVASVTTGTMNYDPVYESTAGGTYGMNMTTDLADHPGVSSLYGDKVADTTGPVNSMNTTYTFGARASNITPAGIYKATMILIATGTF